MWSICGTFSSKTQTSQSQSNLALQRSMGHDLKSAGWIQTSAASVRKSLLSHDTYTNSADQANYRHRAAHKHRALRTHFLVCCLYQFHTWAAFTWSHAVTGTLTPRASVAVMVSPNSACVTDRLISRSDRQCDLRRIYCGGLLFVHFTGCLFRVLGQINGNHGGKIKLMLSRNDWCCLKIKVSEERGFSSIAFICLLI